MIDKLEKKFGKYAIRGLMKYICILYAIGFIISMINPQIYYDWLMLDIDKLLKGQVWRIITFIIQPVGTNNIFRVLLTMFVYFMFGTALEGMWGSFRFNLYYLSGIFFNALAVVAIYILIYAVFGYGYSDPIGLTYLNLTLFLAFAVTFPDTRFGIMGGNGNISMFTVIYLLAVAVDVGQAFAVSAQMGIITLLENLVWVAIFCFGVKAKFMAVAYGILILVEVLSAFYNGGVWSGIVVLIEIVASMLNFLIFFIHLRKKGFSPMNPARRNFRQMARNSHASVRPQSDTERGKVIKIYRPSENGAMHKCAVCGRTEKDDDSLEFRFCSKCNGNYEYCSDHLYTHEHKT